MTSQTNEQALEATIQKRLAGVCLEELKDHNIASTVGEDATAYRTGNGFLSCFLALLYHGALHLQAGNGKPRFCKYRGALYLKGRI